ncbi:MAG: hypothetical protein JJ896_15760 [Rhodothermales bacterium]|nr:hypothetical protein [Rhodothermales bacterium]MBO6781111.1 hypothetical protein [Rhodothermales bacterium]
MVRFLPALIVLVLVAGCDSSDPAAEEEVRTTVDGEWEGVITSDEMSVPITVTMRENLTLVSGEGTVSLPAEDRDFVIERGDYLHPLLNLDLSFADYEPPFGNLDGIVNVDRNEVRGTAAGPGFSGPVELVLRRK